MFSSPAVISTHPSHSLASARFPGVDVKKLMDVFMQNIY
jgi:hypothetical protein